MSLRELYSHGSSLLCQFFKWLACTLVSSEVCGAANCKKLTKRRLSTSNVIAINYILCNLIGAAIFLQAAQVHDANVPRLPLRAWESGYARLLVSVVVHLSMGTYILETSSPRSESPS